MYKKRWHLFQSSNLACFLCTHIAVNIFIDRAQDIFLFRQVWAHFDPAGKGVLPISLLNHVIHRLSTKVNDR